MGHSWNDGMRGSLRRSCTAPTRLLLQREEVWVVGVDTAVVVTRFFVAALPIRLIVAIGDLGYNRRAHAKRGGGAEPREIRSSEGRARLGC
jgi:hypothetical protein